MDPNVIENQMSSCELKTSSFTHCSGFVVNREFVLEEEFPCSLSSWCPVEESESNRQNHNLLLLPSLTSDLSVEGSSKRIL